MMLIDQVTSRRIKHTLTHNIEKVRSETQMPCVVGFAKIISVGTSSIIQFVDVVHCRLRAIPNRTLARVHS